MEFMNRERAEAIMKRRGVDALVASSERNFHYASGFKPWLPYFGPMLTLVPVAQNVAPAIILSSYLAGGARQWSNIPDIRSYPLWMPLADLEDIKKGQARMPEKLPAYFSIERPLQMLSEILRERGLQDARIAIENNLMNDQKSYSLLTKEHPKAKFVEAESIFSDLQKVKSQEEIRVLRGAADLTIKGIQSVVRGGVEHATIGELSLRYKRGVYEAATPENAMQLDSLRAGISSGDFLSSLHWPGKRIEKGEIIWIDAGVNLFGYYADMGRTFSVGKPDVLSRKIFSALKAGYEEGLARVKPGVMLKEIHKAIQDTVNKSGLEWYVRGSMGHMLSIGPGTHQPPPFISAEEETEIEVNMVFSVENAAYVTGLGGFQIEEELLIIPGGYEVLTKELPRDMVEV
jgi:Xaa-Pro dipeptidase